MTTPRITLAASSTRDSSTGLSIANTGHGTVYTQNASVFQSAEPKLLVNFGGLLGAGV